MEVLPISSASLSKVKELLSAAAGLLNASLLWWSQKLIWIQNAFNPVLLATPFYTHYVSLFFFAFHFTFPTPAPPPHHPPSSSHQHRNTLINPLMCVLSVHSERCHLFLCNTEKYRETDDTYCYKMVADSKINLMTKQDYIKDTLWSCLVSYLSVEIVAWQKVWLIQIAQKKVSY